MITSLILLPYYIIGAWVTMIVTLMIAVYKIGKNKKNHDRFYKHMDTTAIIITAIMAGLLFAVCTAIIDVTKMQLQNDVLPIEVTQ